MIAPRTPRPSGMTLTELLVVLAIILLLSAATLPTAYVAFAEREVSEAAAIVQANVSLTRDRATGLGEPQGIRFLPDPDLTDPTTGRIASSRMVTLTTPPNYSEGLVVPVVEIFVPPFTPPGIEIRRLAVYGAKTEVLPGSPPSAVPTTPTSWYYNIRQGDTIRIDGAGNEFTIAGPITKGPTAGNPERFINQTTDGTAGGAPVRALPTLTNPFYEVLYLVNGRDDNDPNSGLPGVGYADATFDGIDNNGDGIVDPGFNGLDDDSNNLIDNPMEMLLPSPALSEYEREEPILKAFAYARINGYTDSNGHPAVRPLNGDLDPANTSVDRPIFSPDVPRHRYVISRRPSVAADAREYSLPGGAVIDLTTANLDIDSDLSSRSERSRVPIDPVTGYVDLMIYPNGQVMPSTPWGFKAAMNPDYPLYFLWIAAREDVTGPQDPDPSTPALEWPLLPLPRESGLVAGRTQVLQGERRIVTIAPNSGYASVSEIPTFGVLSDTNLTPAQKRELPYEEARQHQRTGR